MSPFTLLNLMGKGPLKIRHPIRFELVRKWIFFYIQELFFPENKLEIFSRTHSPGVLVQGINQNLSFSQVFSTYNT